MLRKLGWIILLAAAAAGCLTGSGAVRGELADDAPTAPASAPVGR